MGTTISQFCGSGDTGGRNPSVSPAVPLALGTEAVTSLVARSPQMVEVAAAIALFAASPETVLIRGETGTGKGLVARAIHSSSPRACHPFVPFNCAGVPETLLESELFGYERGAFTGADQRRLGRFEHAGRGTLFLDEVGDLSPSTQVKLLRVLEERCFERLGGNQSIPVQARVLAATNRNLEADMSEQRFREDLFHRLNRLTIEVPPLRSRPEDFPELVRHFLAEGARGTGAPPPSVSPEVLDFLRRQGWRGNVRELRNILTRAGLEARGGPLSLHHLQRVCRSGAGAAAAAVPSEPRSSPASPGSAHLRLLTEYLRGFLPAMQQGRFPHARDRIIEEVDRELLDLVMKAAQGNQTRAAKMLGVSRVTLHDKLRHFGLNPTTDGLG